MARPLLAEIGKAAGGLDYAAVSVALKRFELCALKDPDVPRSRECLTKLLNVETCPPLTWIKSTASCK